MARLEDRIPALVDAEVVRLTLIESRGYAAAFHAPAVLGDGRTVFVKAGAEDVTSTCLREEISVYRVVRAPSTPEFLGADEADPPFLVLEDLSDCFSAALVGRQGRGRSRTYRAATFDA